MHELFKDALPPQKWCIAKSCTYVYSRECGWVLVVRVQQCRAVEQHMQNCEHNLAEQWRLLVHVVC